MLLLDSAAINHNFNVVADQHVTGVEGYIEVNAEVLAVDSGGSFNVDGGLVPKILKKSGEFYVQGDWLGVALNGEVTSDGAAVTLHVGVGCGEGNGGEVLYIKKVSAFDVGIPFSVFGV